MNEIFPEAIDWFTGKAGDDDGLSEISDDDESEDDEDDEDEAAEIDLEKPRPKKQKTNSA